MEETVVIGTYLQTIRRNISTGYTLFNISCKNYDDKKEKGRLLCAGNIPVITRNIPLKLTGHFIQKQMGQWVFIVGDIELYSEQKDITIEYIINRNIKAIWE